MKTPLKTVKVFYKYIRNNKRQLVLTKMNYTASQNNHICRIKEVIYGGIFHPYDPEMNFDYFKSQGWIEIK